MTLVEAVKILRKELLILDEPLKAYYLLKELDIPELKEDLDKTYGLVRHAFEPDIYKKVYGMAGEVEALDCEQIEPRSCILNAEIRYPRYRWILEDLEKTEAKSYIDLACYVGSLVTTAESRGIKSCGVDMTKHVIDVARERAKWAKLDCKFFLDDITTFDKVTGVDAVSANEVIEHVIDPKAFIEHLCSLTKGWIYVTTPNGSYGDGEGNMGHWDWDGEETHVRGHLRVFTKESMFRLLEECGCEISFLEGMNDALLWCKFRRCNDENV